MLVGHFTRLPVISIMSKILLSSNQIIVSAVAKNIGLTSSDIDMRAAKC